MKYKNTVEAAQKYGWSSVTHDLNKERLSYLNNYLIGETILDAGCGGGGYTDYLEHKGFYVTAIDQSIHLLINSKNKGNKGKLVQADIENLPFCNNAFDCSYSFDVLEHVNDHLAYSELVRVTKSRIIFAVPQKDLFFRSYGLVPFSYQDETHLRYYTTEMINILVNSFDHKMLKIFHEGMLPLAKMCCDLSIYNHEIKIIEDLFFKSLRISSIRHKALNNLFTRKFICYLLKIVFNENKTKRILFKQPISNDFYAGLVAIIDL